MTTETFPPGWHHERPNDTSWRFWDGAEWTDFRSVDGQSIDDTSSSIPSAPNRMRLLAITLVALLVIVAYVWFRSPPAQDSFSFAAGPQLVHQTA